MKMLKVQFIATKDMLEWKDGFGKWRDGQVREIPEKQALYFTRIRSNLHLVDESKSAKPSEDKMIKKSRENKSVSINGSGKLRKAKDPDPSAKLIKISKGWKKKR